MCWTRSDSPGAVRRWLFAAAELDPASLQNPDGPYGPATLAPSLDLGGSGTCPSGSGGGRPCGGGALPFSASQ